MDGLLAEAAAVLAGHPDLRSSPSRPGRSPSPPTANRCSDRCPAIAGLHVAFTHSGATLGLIAGELLADQIVTGEPHPLLAPFGPGRFLA